MFHFSHERKEINMTEGPLLPNIIRFMIPLVLTGMLQLLYNAADMVVAGHFAGKEALAAVGSTGAMTSLIVNMFMGFSTGASVIISQNYGARDYEGVRRSVHTTISFSLICSVIIMAVGLIFSRKVLTLMGTPDDVLDLAVLYVKIYFLGIPANLLYNFGASILRAVGDSRHPMYYLTFSGIINVILNLVTVIVFHMGVAGVAVATIISQFISAVLVTVCLIRSPGAIHLSIKELHIYKKEALGIIRVGLPAGIQSSLFDVSNILIQSSLNTFGSIAMAGASASGNIEGFQYCTMNCVSQASITFAGQNYGAKKYDRVRKLLPICFGVLIVSSFGLGALLLAFGRPLLSIYNSDPQVIAFGMEKMVVIVSTQFICGLNDVTASNLRGSGYALSPAIITAVGICGTRILWLYTIFARHHTLQCLFLCYPISWTITFLIEICVYLFASMPKLKRMELNMKSEI